MKPAQTNLISLALFLNRAALGLLFVLAGVRKLMPVDGANMLDKMNGFAKGVADKAPLPEALGKAYGYALPWGEIIFGAMMIVGLFSRLAAVCVALMLLSFLIAFGPAFWPESGPAYDKNIILLTLAMLLATTGSGKLALRADGPLK